LLRIWNRATKLAIATSKEELAIKRDGAVWSQLLVD